MRVPFGSDRRTFLRTAGAAVVIAAPTPFRSLAAASPDPALLRRLDRSGVSPLDFGAAGDGRTNDLKAVTAAISHALDNGYPLDGGEVEYGVAGDISIAGRREPHIASLRLKQLAPANGRNTLAFANCEQIRIDSLAIDVGSSRSLGNMDNTTGLQVRGGSGHRIRDVTVTGDGKITYVRFWLCTDGVFENIYVHDGRFEDQEMDPHGFRVPDDVVQGIHLSDCTNCSLVNPVVRNLTGNATYFNTAMAIIPYANFRTRGIAGGGNTRCTISNPQVSNVEQGMDFSGSGSFWGNDTVQIIGGNSHDCGSVGVKFANAAHRCEVIGHTVENAGMMGFLIAGYSRTIRNFDCQLIGCTSINPGYNDVQFDTDREALAQSGFYVMEESTGGSEGATLVACRAIDKQGFYLVGDDPPDWPQAGATSATMRYPWTAPGGSYPISFTTGQTTETKTATFATGSTEVRWSGGLASAATHPFVSRPAKMQYGFLNDAVEVPPSAAPNRLGSDCVSIGHIAAASKGF